MRENADWLEVVYLPSYRPELNPIEYVWSSWKRTYLANCLANCCPRNTDDLCDVMFSNEAAMCDQRLLQGYLVASGLVSRKDLIP